jgi:mannose-6-phosphate isomerase-like protein (cupin superfamily)
MSYEITNFSWNIQTQDCRALMRSRVMDLERELLKMPQPELPVENFFAGGMYARALHIPMNVALTGAIHKREHFSILLSGDMTVTTDVGPRRISPGEVIVCHPGTKRAGFAHADSVWLTIERTDKTDPDEAQEELVTNDFDAWLKEQECHLQLPPAF